MSLNSCRRPLNTCDSFLKSWYDMMMPLGLSGGDQVNLIARGDRIVTKGAGCSEGAAEKPVKSRTKSKAREKGDKQTDRYRKRVTNSTVMDLDMSLFRYCCAITEYSFVFSSISKYQSSKSSV